MTKEGINGTASNVAYGIKNLLFTLLGSIVLLFIGAVVATYLTISEAAVSLIVAVITWICVIAGSFRLSRRIGSQGLLTGSLSGLAYIMIILCIGFLVTKEFTFTAMTWLNILMTVICGAIGGIVGVNTNTKSRR